MALRVPSGINVARGFAIVLTLAVVIRFCASFVDGYNRGFRAGFTAVGLPGANNWKHYYSRVLDGWDKIMLFCDGDNAGREMAKNISRELDNVFPVFMPDNQDVNDVFLTEGADGLRRRVGITP